MTRRVFLGSLLSVILGTLILIFILRPRQIIYNFAVFFKPRLDSSSATGSLSEKQMENLVAFGEALLEEQSMPEERRNDLIRHIDHRARNTPGFFLLYGMTADLLDRLAGMQFSKLPLTDCLNLITRNRLMVHDVKAREYLSPFHRQELTVRTLAVPDLITGYYSSPAGWAVVGYHSFPGRCGDLSSYTRANA
jgi:hypothetical protein